MPKQRSVKHRNEHPKQVDGLNTIEHDFSSKRYDYLSGYGRDWYNRNKPYSQQKPPQKVPFCINPKWDKCYGR